MGLFHVSIIAGIVLSLRCMRQPIVLEHSNFEGPERVSGRWEGGKTSVRVRIASLVSQDALKTAEIR